MVSDDSLVPKRCFVNNNHASLKKLLNAGMMGFAIEAVFGLFGSKPVNIAIKPVFLANGD